MECRRLPCFVSLLVTVCVGFVVAPRLLADVYAEQEPNNTKYTGNEIPFAMASGDAITGVTTGSSQTATGDPSQDNFLVKTAMAPLGFYRHRLQLSGNPVTYNSSILGLVQTNGVIMANTDVIAQSAPPNPNGTMPARTVEWYGFGRSERIYYRVSGNSNTIGSYTATLSTVQVQPQVLSDPLQAGPITITDAAAFNFFDIWVYDANLNAIPGYGHENPESLTRNFTPGTYYIALGKANFANNQPAPPDDLNQNSPVLDFADAALTSSQIFNTSVDVNIVDSAGSHFVPATLPGSWDIIWLQITVVGNCTCAGDMDANGVFNGRDTTGFVSSLLAGSGSCADINNDTVVNTNDIGPFINLLLAGQTCN